MKTITAIIETPKGSAQKYDYEPKLRLFKLKKIMPAGMVFPFDFGFIPDTRGGDGDPLDIVVISEFAGFTGCVIDCRLIGAITAEQTGQDKTMRNDRFFAVPEVSEMYKTIYSLNDLPEKIITELESFFINYNKIEGKQFKPLARINATEA